MKGSERPPENPTHAAAEWFVQRALATRGSLFSPDRPVWTPSCLADLHGRHHHADDTVGGDFTARWARRLEGAPSGTVQLAAELAYIHALFADDLTPASKRRLVTATLDRCGAPQPIPEPLDAALDQGIAATGILFKTRRMAQLGLLIDVAAGWWDQDGARRREALRHPSAFKAFLFAIPHDGAYSQREALLHLIHPTAFEPIVSPRVKRRIVQALSQHVPAGVEDVDAALAGIRIALERRHGTGWRFTDPPISALWQPERATAG